MHNWIAGSGFMAGKHAAAQCVATVCTKLSAADSPPVSGRQTRITSRFQLQTSRCYYSALTKS